MAEERKPVLKVSQIALRAIDATYRRQMQETLQAALEADALDPKDGWQLSADATEWTRTVKDG